ncbi:hypothetical protein CP533_3497 [Ophiocordyceps camponoti-saundersi (nom. inval.)]|nr:hypothetical protein CP533_3497 [Ophiocordyceps camponoti-saundersi (nom. inval.)]
MSPPIPASRALSRLICRRCFSSSSLPPLRSKVTPFRVPSQPRRTKYKTVEQARSRQSTGPFSWKAGIVFVTTCAGLVWYFESEKERMKRKRIADATKGVGKPKVGGNFDLVDQDGKPFTSDMLKGKHSLVYFGFTRCPDICPEELDKMARMLDLVEAKAPGTLLPIFVTCDPARDDPKALKSYLAEFHPAFIGLTGTYDQIKDMCKKYRVYFSTPQEVKPGQDYLVDHSIYFYLMDPEGDFVEALELGRIRQFSSAKLNKPSSGSSLSDFAFAFDIDGVLYRGSQPIPSARAALQTVRSLGVRYVFLTNGGGVSEDVKVDSLNRRLGFSPEQDIVRGRLIVSHSPFRDWRHDAKQQTVLITASDPETARAVANEYGFANAVTPADIVHGNDKYFPFDQLRDSLHSRHRPFSPDAHRFDSILVWNDPRDWALDIQVIHDLLVSRQGYLGTISDKNGDSSLPNKGWQQDGQPQLWISNLDLFWKTEYPVNRFGTGAFVEALKGVWSAVTDGAELKFQALGKPFGTTYDYAHKRLLRYYSDVAGSDTKHHPLRRVYMIGDNPESDIRGANEFHPEDGTEWISILVRTGVWKKTMAEPEPRHQPAVIVDDVMEAVSWALEKEGQSADIRDVAV